ncbi:MAG: hypothetical protein ABIZ50_01950 [Solirubrobacterales bacterium]
MKKLSLIAVGLIACLAIGSASLAVAGQTSKVKKVKSKISLTYTAATTGPATTTPGTTTPGTPCTPYTPCNPCDPYTMCLDPYTPDGTTTPGTTTPGKTNDDASFKGAVSSKKKLCKKGRKVKVKNVDTGQTFGEKKTDKAGNYGIAAGAGAAKGTYIAKVKKKVKTKKNGGKIVCKKAKSKTVTVS